MKSKFFVLTATFGIVLTTGLLIAGVVEPGFEITRSSIDGGGVMKSTGGEFELSGTIGQPDAGVMSAGEFELTGGFWFALAPTDCNEDGLINADDYEIFAACMLGPNLGIDASPCSCFDVDGDGDITLSDFAVLQKNFVQ